MGQSTFDSQRVATAFTEWTAAIGADHVVRAEPALRAAETATFATIAEVGAILRPANRHEVQECVRVANRHGLPLYVVSSGKNWGYGSGAPVLDGVRLDLGRMNRIVDFDEDLAYVTIEPGVTQQQLYDFLRARHSRLWMDATGASPDCSIIGNTMERGFGHTPMGDHCANACGFEVVLANGECIETGYGRFDGTKTGPLNRWGVGPSLDGLFSQSNLGIVTRMSVWLMPAPEHFAAFFFVSKKADGLPAIIDALRPLRLNGTLRSTIHIGNDYKVLTSTTQFPWSDASVRPPLGEDVMKGLREKLSVGYWQGSGGIYGSRAQVKDAKRQVKAALAGKVERLQFVNDRVIRLMSGSAPIFRMLTGWDVSKILTVLLPVYNLMKGTPTTAPLFSAYWRKRTVPPAQPDPDRDRCGLLWSGPVVPSTGAAVKAVTALVSRVLLAHGFEPQMSISLATERSAICLTTISYDREVPGEDERALTCYQSLTDELIASGFPPYRLTIRSMERAAGTDSYAHVLRALKQSLDPNNILAPGRYDGHPIATAAARDDTVLVRTR